MSFVPEFLSEDPAILDRLRENFRRPSSRLR